MPDKDQSGVLHGRATSALEQQQIIFDLLGAKKRACQDMGLEDHLAFVDPAAPHPLPVYRQGRWSGDPSFLRHPLAWLPPGLAELRTAGQPRTTTTRTRLRAAATMLALTAAGLWSADAGFLDVARHFGFDVTSNRGRLRAQAWMDGASDAHFDAVEREMHRRIRQVSNVRAAEALMPAIRCRQAHLATEIAAVIGQTERSQLFEALPSLLALACDVVGDQPYRSALASDGLRALAARLELAADAEDQCEAEQVSVAAACLVATIALQSDPGHGIREERPVAEAARTPRVAVA